MNCTKCGKKMIEFKEKGKSTQPRCRNPACGTPCPKCGSEKVGNITLSSAECGDCGEWFDFK